jgi:uncharacterized protein
MTAKLWSGMKPHPHALSGRRRLWLLVAGLVCGVYSAIGGLFVWGVAIEPYLLTVTTPMAVIPALPPAWVGQRVAVMGDLQVGMWMATTTVRYAVEKVLAEHPTLVLLLGDFIYHPGQPPDREIATMVALLRPLPSAGLSVYAVLGNHDYAATSLQAPKNEALAARVRQALEAIGIRVLVNEAVALPPPSPRHVPKIEAPPDDPLYLVGIGSDAAGVAAPEKAVSRVPGGAARLVMMHDPELFTKLPAGTAPLALAGHTHGGQVRLPFLPLQSPWQVSYRGQVQVSGWIEGYGQPGNYLYVNRGIGFSRLPIRINAPPELTLFTLQSNG